MSTKKSAIKVVPVPSLADGQIFVHNSSRGTFHVPLTNESPTAREKPIVFALDEIRKLDEQILKEQRFQDCFDAGYLERFTPAQYEAHLKEKARKKSSEAKSNVIGNHESGLPMNRTMAIQQIGLIDDSDLLEALLEKEDRASIMAAIEERVEALQDNLVD
jgi:hypothetical protein